MRAVFLSVVVMTLGVISAMSISGKAACDSTNCKLPDCLCMNTTAPLGLKVNEIPQLVFLTFDDAVADWMMPMYDRILKDRVNPNGCPVTMTFYVTHDGGTNYEQVNKFYNQGHEMASHTVTHKDDNAYWRNGDVQHWTKEVDQQRDIISLYSNIPKNKIQGHRAPYLQTSGDPTFEALKGLGMTYDSSLPSVDYMNPPIWPFTLDYGVTHDCTIPPCTTGQYQGLWDIPMVAFESREENLCSMPDSCGIPSTAEETFQYFLWNFDRYQGTRAPFGVYQHVYWFAGNDHILDGFIQFLDYLASLDYVYIVTVSKGLEWIKNPLTLAELQQNDIFGCNPAVPEPAPCSPQTCVYQDSVPGGGRTMRSCSPCPAVFPWLDNPTGSP